MANWRNRWNNISFSFLLDASIVVHRKMIPQRSGLPRRPGAVILSKVPAIGETTPIHVQSPIEPVDPIRRTGGGPEFRCQLCGSAKAEITRCSHAAEQRARSQRQPAIPGDARRPGLRLPVETPNRRQILAAAPSSRQSRPTQRHRLRVRRESRRCLPAALPMLGRAVAMSCSACSVRSVSSPFRSR